MFSPQSNFLNSTGHLDQKANSFWVFSISASIIEEYLDVLELHLRCFLNQLGIKFIRNMYFLIE